MDKPTLERIKKLINNSGFLCPTVLKSKNSITYPFSQETILITGAAGSIGSGLTKLLLSSRFNKLILLDNAETPLFFLKRDIDKKKLENIEFILGDIRDDACMRQIFNKYKPTIIFHTAAYKHVSLVEENAFEGIKTNIFATQSLAQLALKHYSKRFIFISTDKAVNPIGIMGMTKLISENYLSELNDNPNSTRFISARFGNIFGSNGSVVPLFIQQLKSGKNITITHKEATRLFIDKNEACHLILKLAELEISKYNKVSFDMGKPIKIKDLAETLIMEFKGIEKKSSDIIISELSIGEKLHESLITENERLVPTAHKNIFYIERKKIINYATELGKLKTINQTSSYLEIKDTLSEICIN